LAPVPSRQSIPTGSGEVDLYIFEPEARSKNGPAVYWMHGGGYILGHGDDPTFVTDWLALGCTVVSVDYRLAPEDPFPAGPEDCHSGLLWTFDNAANLGIDPDRIAIGGASAGGGMCAGMALMNRDRKGPKPAFQMLLYPMLDNLHATDSGRLKDHAIWTRESSLNAWEMYLGGTPGEKASPYAAASRATDVSGMPPTCVTVGGADLFRDECIAYAQLLMAQGVATELSVFPGICHAGEVMLPDLDASKDMRASIAAAMRRGLNLR
jgi:acetyl esterase